MSALIATIVLTSVIMLATIAIVIISTRFSANREQRWLDWSQQHSNIDYQSRKFIDQRQHNDWSQLLQYQHRFVAHWLENQVPSEKILDNAVAQQQDQALSSQEITSKRPQWMEHPWRYFECSMLIRGRMKTQSLILISCPIPGASPWLINHQVHTGPDAFHQGTPMTLHSVQKKDLPIQLRNIPIQAERPHFIRQILSDNVIKWLKEHPQLAIGWIHNTLIIYRLGHLITPNNLPNALTQVLQLQQLLQNVKSMTGNNDQDNH